MFNVTEHKLKNQEYPSFTGTILIYLHNSFFKAHKFPFFIIHISYKTINGGIYVKGNPEERAILLAEYIIENKSTVRKAAQVFHISKSTIHKDVTTKLKKINPSLAKQVSQILAINKSQRHLRGGAATKEKYMLMKQHSKPSAPKAPSCSNPAK